MQLKKIFKYYLLNLVNLEIWINFEISLHATFMISRVAVFDKRSLQPFSAFLSRLGAVWKHYYVSWAF